MFVADIGRGTAAPNSPKNGIAVPIIPVEVAADGGAGCGWGLCRLSSGVIGWRQMGQV